MKEFAMIWTCSLDGENKKCRILIENLMEEMDNISMCIRETEIMKKCVGNIRRRIYMKRLPHIGRDRLRSCG
jgi:hypothetical protein